MNDTRFPVIEKVRAWYHRKPSQQQKTIKKYGVIGAFAIIMLGFYYATGQDKSEHKAPPVKTDISDDKTASLIQDDIINTLDNKIDQQNNNIDTKVNDAIADAIKKGAFNLTPPQTATGENSALTEAATSASSATTQGNGELPGMSSYPQPTSVVDNGQQQNTDSGNGEAAEVMWVGGISDNNGDIPLPSAPQEPASKKDQIQLPVGFMKAKLLVGINALTGQFGSDNPQTLMFRVQAPAQLPNFIKMNLRGCFSIANASGNLSSERIIVLPVSIHCMTMDGRYMVEGQVKGFVSDRDGKRDMSARVVSRAGRLLAGAVLAKSAESFANVIGNQSIQQSNSPLGSVNTIKPDEATSNAAATGVAGGFTEVSKYLLNLAQQTSPALETGPGKDVTLFIQETAELTIKQVRIK
ncbi:TraB/VirB10 family protein (plasmid) [Enterobacter hormaechei]|uniref:TraB/VirB10 family protein n=1 Tax=Enterobacter hormaechei TaxID=158836 RepID=UPI0027D2BCDC|nr:TraB/VirB10 family protein [Enterobacter hormaechei]WLZ52007.1 TraB/VirB10 family protein [Enterobacter hormaechei]